jgi:CheY-like chemotaxis protein
VVVLVYVFVAIFFGMVGTGVAITLGMSFGGALLVYSAVGVISVFAAAFLHIALSGRRIPEAGRTAAPVSEPQRQQCDDSADQMKILAVDDDPFILELMPKIAVMANCRGVETVRSGHEALAMLTDAAQPYDCFLLDINMPEMDGITLCTRIRSLPQYRDTPIIMLTAVTDIEHLNLAFRAGASDYTSKPFDIIEFGDRLRIAKAWTAAKRTQSHTQMPDVAGPQTSAGAVARLADVAALVSPMALQNYLLRIKGPALNKIVVVGIGIEPSPDSPDLQDSPTRTASLVRLASCICDSFAQSNYVMTLLGQGEFVVVSCVDLRIDPVALEADIQTRYDRIDGAHARPAGGMVCVGAPVHPALHGTDRARNAVDMAARLARDRAARRRAPNGGVQMRPIAR